MLFTPAPLTPLKYVANDPKYLFELKHDGFRALAHIADGACRLVSRKGHVYKAFTDLCSQIARLNRNAVLDGEIVILDSDGKSQFYDLMRRRPGAVFYAFDCLSLDGEDLRALPLIERKRRLKALIGRTKCILFAKHVERTGESFFRLICEQDLEGIVAKRRDGAYGEDWFKIRNPRYSQYEGRRELFDRKR